MTTSPRSSRPKLDQLLLEDFVKDLEHTTVQLQSLLQDIHENEIEFMAIKTELKIFIEHVKDLSSLIRENPNGTSLLTRVAIMEKSIAEIERWIKENHQKNESQKSSPDNALAADKAGKWQLYTAIVTGVLGLITSSISLVFNLLNKH